MFRSVSIPNPRNPKEKVQGGGLTGDTRIMGAVMRAWKECFPPPSDGAEVADKDLWKMPPKLRRMKAYLNKFQGQGWSLKEAQAWAKSQGAPPPEWIQAVMFYELYEGFKGSLGPNWRPRLCKEPPRSYDKFVKEVRFGKSRISDFNDMLVVFRNILRRNEKAKAAIQGTFKHIMVDECQDLNQTQMEIFQLMSEHIATDDTDRSFWMVGDSNQAIYGFRGSSVELFNSLEDKGFKTRTMATNFRCLPEIVESANRLISNNPDQRVEARANPEKPHGKASILVESPEDTASAAISFGARVKKAMLAGDPLCEFAVLARTNAELHDFETGCIIRGIPYVRKGSSSFLGSYESQVAMSFIDFVTADSNEVMQANFAKVIYNSSRFLMKGNPEQFENVLKGVFTRYCMSNRVDKKDFNPLVALMNDSEFGFELVRAITGATLKPGEEWKAEKDLDQLTDLLTTLAELRGKVIEEGYKTKDLLNDILSIEGVELVLDENGRMVRKAITLKDKIVRQLASKVSDEDQEEDDSSTEGEEPLGALAFFYTMMEPDPTELDLDPSKPIDFRMKIDRFKARATDLRIDPAKWEKEQRAKPLDKREKPPGVFLATVHATKGSEWQDVTTLMPKGRFPIEFKPRKAKKNDVPEVPLIPESERLESERRLGYVALTRAIKNLTVVCPKVVNNQPAGTSPFVIEAGLQEGENVKRPGDTPTEVKTASEEFVDDLGAYLEDWSDVIVASEEFSTSAPAPEQPVGVDLAERVAARLARKSEWK
jgi:superfamily I DNA/RNA helicase